MSKDFLLDSKLRTWVFLPIVLITLFVEVLRHYSMLLFNNKTNLTMDEIQNLEMKKRVTLLQKNYKYIPKVAFETRKAAFHPETGFLTKTPEPTPQKKMLQPFLITNQEKFLNMVKGHSSNHLPIILAGAWVSYTFSGFICTKVPLPLTFSFKQMLQRNIDLVHLNPSWVSSCSWYFLNVFGLRNFLNMFFEERVESELPEMDCFGEGIKVCFKEDFNNLEMTVHENGLCNIEEVMH